MTDNPQREIIVADPRVRKVVIAAALLAALAAIGLYYYGLPAYLGYLTELLNESPSRGKAEFQRLIDGFMLLMVVSVAGFAGYLAYTGRKVLQSGQFPPPGARVLVDTPVVRGPGAARRGKLMLAAAALIVVVCLPGLWLAHALMTDLLAELPETPVTVPSGGAR